MKQHRHWIITPALLLAVAVIGIAWSLGYGGFLGRNHRESLSGDSGLASHPAGSIAVTVAPVQLRPVQRTVVSVGTLHAFEQVTVSSKVEGRVLKIRHDIGDRVKPGDLLLEIDPTDFQLSERQVQSALDVELAKLGLDSQSAGDFDVNRVPSVVEASVKQARIKERVERMRTLVERGAMSRDELSNLTSDFRSLQAEHDNQVLLAKSGLATVQMKREALAIARQQLKDTRISAPLPSMVPPGAEHATYAVTGRTTAEGSFVRVGTEVFKLVMDRLLKLKVPVPDRFVADVREGQTVKIATAAYDTAFDGKVTRINPAVDPATRTFEVEIQLSNAHGRLKSGSFAKAAIETRHDAAVATVPLEAIVRFAGITKIFVVENDHVREMPVTPGVMTEQWIEIASPPIPKDAQVVTSGQAALADGSPVSIRVSSPNSAARGTERRAGSAKTE